MLLLLACTAKEPPVTCPQGMVHIQGGAWDLGRSEDPGTYLGGWLPVYRVELKSYCIDAFPFPGREGAPYPLDGLTWDRMIVLEEALVQHGRRPCTVSELLRAGAGPDNWRYPTHATEWQKERCETNDLHPKPLGTYPDCKTPEGVHEFQVRSTWGTLDEPAKAAFLSRWPPEDLWFEGRAVWGGTARSDTFYAPDNSGLHFHGPGVDQFEDDNFRVCADPGKPPTDPAAYSVFIDTFVEHNNYKALFSSPG